RGELAAAGARLAEDSPSERISKELERLRKIRQQTSNTDLVADPKSVFFEGTEAERLEAQEREAAEEAAKTKIARAEDVVVLSEDNESVFLGEEKGAVLAKEDDGSAVDLLARPKETAAAQTEESQYPRVDVLQKIPVSDVRSLSERFDLSTAEPARLSYMSAVFRIKGRDGRPYFVKVLSPSDETVTLKDGDLETKVRVTSDDLLAREYLLMKDVSAQTGLTPMPVFGRLSENVEESRFIRSVISYLAKDPSTANELKSLGWVQDPSSWANAGLTYMATPAVEGESGDARVKRIASEYEKTGNAAQALGQIKKDGASIIEAVLSVHEKKFRQNDLSKEEFFWDAQSGKVKTILDWGGSASKGSTDAEESRLFQQWQFGLKGFYNSSSVMFFMMATNADPWANVYRDTMGVLLYLQEYTWGAFGSEARPGEAPEVTAFRGFIKDEISALMNRFADQIFSPSKPTVEELHARLDDYLRDLAKRLEVQAEPAVQEGGTTEDLESYAAEIYGQPGGATGELGREADIRASLMQMAKVYNSVGSRKAYEEDLVKSVQEGPVQVASIKIQDFKGQFNTRGEELGLGHKFGDAALATIGPHFKDRLREQLTGTGIDFNIYMDGPVLSVIFTNARPGDARAQNAIQALIEGDTEFKRSLIGLMKDTLIGSLDPETYADVLSRPAMKEFNSTNVNFYAGISSTDETASNLQAAINSADRLDQEASDAAKFTQLNFNKTGYLNVMGDL
ncbi:MAG TPA: hypothetical protein VD883_01425, partial [Candidatus Omnitrophota bacterium]|nr:hypothetical protein [Candidatus Omnitrophota bacterium]